MPNSKKPPMGEMAYATAFVAFQGAAMAWMSLGYTTGYFSWKRAVAAVILTSLAAGIWYRLRYARLGAILVLTGGAVLILTSMLRTELNLNQLAWIAALIWCCWTIWRGYEDEAAGPADDAEAHRGAVALVALLPDPVTLDEAAITAAARRALGPETAVFGGGMFWAVRTKAGVLRVAAAARPWFSDHSADTTHADEHRAVRAHNAWLSVDAAEPASVDLSAALPLMGRLMAELAPHNALAIHAPATNEFLTCRNDWREKLADQLPFRIPEMRAAAAAPGNPKPPASEAAA